MSFNIAYFFELIKSVLPSFILLLITWLIGQRVIAYWDLKKKRREIELTTTIQFQQLFGDYKEITKLWRLVTHYKDRVIPFPKDIQWELLQKAVNAENRIESLLMKLVSERKLDETQLKTLGLFRQSFHLLRIAIREKRGTDYSIDSAYYSLFNKLYCEVASLIASGKQSCKITHEKACENLERIISIRAADYELAISNLQEKLLMNENKSNKEINKTVNES